MYIDLKILAASIENEIELGAFPTLAILKYGYSKDSTSYIRSIERKALQLGVNIIVQDLEGTYNPREKILEMVRLANAILPIKPFPEVLEEVVVSTLVSFMDVDNFSEKGHFLNCTAEATLEILKYLGIGLEKKICILGRGIGFQIHETLLRADYSPVPIHSKTPNVLARKTIKNADVVISATGVRDLIKRDMVKSGALIVDIGLGDIAKGVEEIADVTTLKDGTGAVTTAILFKHIFQTVK